MKKLLKFGEIGINNLAAGLFWSGIVPIAIFAYIFVKQLFAAAPAFSSVIRQSYGEYNTADLYLPLQNHPLQGAVAGLILFAACAVIWKLACEILLIILKYLKSNTKA